MRILFSTVPAHGHLLPLLPLADAAKRSGHDVVVATGREGVIEAVRRGSTAWDVGPSRAETDAAFRSAVPDLSVIASEQRIPTVVAGAIAAARTGASHVVHGLGPLAPEAWSWFGSRFAELCAAWDVPELAEVMLETRYVDTCPPSFQSDAVADFRNRLALRPSAGDVVSEAALPWADATLRALPFERTIHVTLGTIFYEATAVFETVLAGLRPLPVNVIVALGPGADPRRLGDQPANVLVTHFAPHAALLPYCDGLITQGGAGTILAALCHGLPHLILPQGADQFLNAATAERAGVALQLPPPALTPDAVTAAVEQLLHDDTIRANAEHIRAEIATMPAPGAVLDTILSSTRASTRAWAEAERPADERLRYRRNG